jgi:hypothetical protein
MTRLCVIVSVGVVLGAIALTGCDAPPATGQAQADASTRAACQQHAEQVYEQQNRGEIYGPASQVNMPYSANYTPSVTDRGLSDLFVHDKMVSDCIRNTGTGAELSTPSSAQTR